MDNIPEYIENKKHPENIHYSTPLLAPILDVTYGIIVYQGATRSQVKSLSR
jgi:DNA polymerase-3 subunit alpha